MKNLWKEIQMESPDVVIRTLSDDGTEPMLLHSHNFYEMIFCIKGKLHYLLDGKRFLIYPGDIILIPPGLSHQPLFLEPMAESYERYIIWIDSDFWEKSSDGNPVLDFSFRQCRDRNNYLLRTHRATWAGLFGAVKWLNDEFTKKDFGWEVSVRNLLIHLMVHISRTFYYQNLSIPDAEKNNLMDDVCLYVTAHLRDKLTLESVAQHFLVSKSTISHLFSSQFQVSFYQWIIQRRLITAKNSILSGTQIQHVWECCGFGDYSSFYRAFKKEFGLSPQEFKKKFCR